MTNQFNKLPLNNEEMMDYPYFFKMKKLRLNGKASSERKKRTLSITPKSNCAPSQHSITNSVKSPD